MKIFLVVAALSLFAIPARANQTVKQSGTLPTTATAFTISVGTSTTVSMNCTAIFISSAAVSGTVTLMNAQSSVIDETTVSAAQGFPVGFGATNFTYNPPLDVSYKVQASVAGIKYTLVCQTLW